MSIDLEPELLLTKKMVAKAFGVTPRAVTDWKVSPAGMRGRAKVYYLPEVLEYKLKSLEGSGKASLELTEERARLTHHQANLAALEEKKARQDVFTATDVIVLCQKNILNARSRILALHSKVAQRFPHVELEVINEIDELCRDALDQIGKGGIPRELRKEVIAAFRRYIADPASGGLEAEEARFLASVDKVEAEMDKASSKAK